MQIYSQERVAEALAALDLNGGNVKRTALQLEIPRTTLIMWRDTVGKVPDTSKREARVEAHENQWTRIGNLYCEYLEANLRAGVAQALIASEPDYLRKQPAGELAILHGVMQDKARLLGQSMEHAALERQRLQLEAGAITTDVGASHERNSTS